MTTASSVTNELHYRKTDGSFIWRYGYRAGRVAGGNHLGYIRITFEGKGHLAHRLVWLIHHGEWPKDQIDHVNGIKTDKRIENLRSVGQAENNRDARVRIDNSTGIQGVVKRGGRYRGRIHNNSGKQISATFDTISQAQGWRKHMEKKLGYHKNHGRVS